jgi:pimeloyl-ACP methyl ester carboxylesterase
VPGDSPASLVRGTDGSSTHLVFMPGLCSNAYAYLLAFPEVARAHGGIVAIDGDRPCGAADSGFRSFTWSPKLQRSRLEAALSAAGVPIPPDGLTLIGYSSGASIAELMHGEWPALFPRLVLIAPPKDPSVARLKTAAGVVFMACSLDVTGRMKSAAKNLVPAGVPSLYLEMPGCTHGNMADGERIFGEAFDWLEERR